ncbi:hypothetical protein ACJD0Z_01035 [Flavobacteriaceae bacterium M23B6Z8]
MKKKQLQKLKLKKMAISKLESAIVKGGTLSTYTQPTVPLEECYATIAHTMCNGKPYCEVL